MFSKTQHAVVTKGQGGYEQLEYRIDVAVLEIPADGDRYALLRVLAAALNNTDINTRLGWYGKMSRAQQQTPARSASGRMDLLLVGGPKLRLSHLFKAWTAALAASLYQTV